MSKKTEDHYIEITEDSDRRDFSFHKHDVDPIKTGKKSKPLFSEKEKANLKWWAIIILIILIYLFHDNITQWFFDTLRSNPTLYRMYLGLENEIAANTLNGLFTIAILGSLFFLFLPSEAIFVYYLEATAYPFFIIIFLMLLGNLVGLIFNYFVGRVLGERVIRFMFKKNFGKYEKRVDKYGGIVLLLGNIFPGPVETITIFYGGFKFNFARYVYLCAMGRFIKYVILFFLYTMFWEHLMFYYHGILGYLLSL